MSSKSVVSVAALALALGLTACATPTPYQPMIGQASRGGGYSELKLENNRFRVNFQGNSLTSRETVEGYLLFRSAELTVQSGYDWFSIVERDVDKKTRTYIDQDPFYHPWYGGYGYWRPYWRYYGAGFGWQTWSPFYGDPFWGNRVDVRTIERFEATAEIVMGKGAKPKDDVRAFDAHAVIENLKPRIAYPVPKT